MKLDAGARCVPGKMRCIEPRTGIAVSVHMPKPVGAPWRSIVIVSPNHTREWPHGDIHNSAADFSAQWEGMKAIVKDLAERLGLDPKTRTRVRGYGYRHIAGRVYIYRGTAPTPEEKKLFKRALKLAACIPGAKVELDEDIKKEIG